MVNWESLSYGLSTYAIRIFSPKHIPSVLQMSKIFGSSLHKTC